MQASDTVANLGCGLGPQAVVYKGKFAKMVGVDLHAERLEDSKILLAEHGVTNYETLFAPVDATGLPDASFDKVLAIDIIEHVMDPVAFLREIHRLLKPGGMALISVPALHDRYVHGARAIANMLGRKTKPLPHGHLDAHNTDQSLGAWMRMIQSSPLRIVRLRASTLWPPLHLYGVPRFWFTNPVIHAVDRVLCQLPILRHLGQAGLIIVKKDS